MLEYIIIGLLVVVINLLIISLLRKNNNNEMIERLGKFETNFTKSLGDFKYEFSNENYVFLNNLINKYRRFLTI